MKLSPETKIITLSADDKLYNTLISLYFLKEKIEI